MNLSNEETAQFGDSCALMLSIGAMYAALNDANIVQAIQSFLPTESLLKTLQVSRTWYQSVRMETWRDSCDEKHVFQILQEVTGMDARTIACGLLVASRDGPSDTRLENPKNRDTNEDEYALLIHIKDELSNKTLKVASPETTVDLTVVFGFCFRIQVS